MAIYAVDFDGTLCEECYPEIGDPIRDNIALVRKLKENGHSIILWTCRTDERLKAAVEWCSRRGITFDAVNENLAEILSLYPTDSRKIYADFYIDDKNLNLEG